MIPVTQRALELLAGAVSWSGGEAGYALPRGSLDFLAACVEEFRLARVFEFGSGASTRRFLEAGCEVTALENDAHWLEQTLAQVPGPLRARLHVERWPLERVWCGGFPCLGWRLTEAMRAQLFGADLVLVDSPAYPPFREVALMQALRLSRARMVVLDDVRIPTLRRFCERIAAQSTGLELKCIERDHTLGVFICHDAGAVRNKPDAVEWLKGWRRFMQGWLQER